jgi:hypothetical protein
MRERGGRWTFDYPLFSVCLVFPPLPMVDRRADIVVSSSLKGKTSLRPY